MTLQLKCINFWNMNNTDWLVFKVLILWTPLKTIPQVYRLDFSYSFWILRGKSALPFTILQKHSVCKESEIMWHVFKLIYDKMLNVLILLILLMYNIYNRSNKKVGAGELLTAEIRFEHFLQTNLKVSGKGFWATQIAIFTSKFNIKHL